MSTLRRTAAAALAVGTVLAVPVLAASPASASGGGGTRVQVQGTCVGGGTWKLKAKPDDGRVEVEFEVDTNRNGQTWSVKVTDNGGTVFSGTRRTLAPSGSFTVERRTADRAGRDVIIAKATRGKASCTGRLTL